MLPSIDAAPPSDHVQIVEVGPRDGLQNEERHIATEDKLRLIDRLIQCGFSRIEVTAFVSPKWVPQMSDHEAVMRGATRQKVVELSALVPNERGARAAIAAGAEALAVFTSASETFSQRNTNCTIEEGLARFVPVFALADEAGIPVRSYISCAVDCPYEGSIAPDAVARVVARLRGLGDGEIALSDTIGRGTPETISPMIQAALEEASASSLAGHFHDTNGRAIENVEAAWELGLRVFDGAVGGLGGCPYAPGAAGNLSTGLLVDYFEGKGIATGIDRKRLSEVEEIVADWKSDKSN